MWWFRESDIIDGPEFFVNKKDGKHSRYICSQDGGNIATMYVRVFAFNKTRIFNAINMFQCEKCFQFYAMEDGTRNLVQLVILRKEEYEKLVTKNGGDKK